jgi:hypothetical protein
MAVCACTARVNLIALANLAYGWGKLATKASYHRRIDLQSQAKICQQSL